MKTLKRKISMLIVVAFLLSLTVISAKAENPDSSKTDTIQAALPQNAGDNLRTDAGSNYENYIAKYKDQMEPEENISIAASGFSDASDNTIIPYKNKYDTPEGIEWSANKGWVEWNVYIQKGGLYNIKVKYFPLEVSSANISIGLLIDGNSPFKEVDSCMLSRVWKDATDILKQDEKGNDLRPDVVQVPEWREEYLNDSNGLYGNYKFYFSQGQHKLRIKSDGVPFLLEKINFNQESIPIAYKDYSTINNQNSIMNVENYLNIFQAEKSYKKSNITLYPTYDRSNPLTEPFDTKTIKLNTIGGNMWKDPGQWISWKFTVPKNGLYQIGIKYRQNYLNGLFVTRRIYIDGKVPFKELDQVKFNYSTQWENMILGDGQPYQFYLKAGTHELKLENIYGEFTETLNTLQKVVRNLNDEYRKVIMVTSTTPDAYTDYYIGKQVPDISDVFNNNAAVLEQESSKIKRITGKSGSEVSFFQSFAYQLRDLSKNPDQLKTRLNNFESNVSALSGKIQAIEKQPLDIDYFVISAPGTKMPRAKPNILEWLKYYGATFINSFSPDNDQYKSPSKSNSIKVWVGTGRDQLLILKQLIDNQFVPKYGINVDLELVQGSLLEATLAGKGPDVALHVGKEQPINLAVRGALTDLSKYRDFDEVKQRFFSETIVPYQYQGKTYALPEQQVYNMLFYRKDILNSLGIKPPQTWDDFYKIIPIIERNNMNIGISSSTDLNTGTSDIFATFLYQNGGSYYKDKNTRTTFDESVALAAFKQWTDFYTNYSLPLAFSFYNRFRTGEMPLAVQPYTMYNLLSVSAPEIKGLWVMAPVPGVLQPDGSIKRTEAAAGGSSTVLFKNTKNKDAAWEFIKWWTSADVQAQYGTGLEALMGPSARYPTANVEAMRKLPWNMNEYDLLMLQWKDVKEVPEIPGSYYTGRGLQNAFRDVTYNHKNPRESLFYWNEQINEELARKAEEFKLSGY